VAELEESAACVGTTGARASAARAAGVWAAANGDLETARLRLEDAVDLLGVARAPFERAEARLELALVLDRLMRTGEGATALEHGWLLHELTSRFELTLEDLGRRFARSASWVSRRLALVEDLPETIQEHVRRGELPAHAAMKHLVPLARANAAACERLVAAIAGHGLSNRQIGQLYAAWRDGLPAVRERVLAAPLLLLKARHAIGPVPEDEARLLMDDFDLLAAVARRARRRLRQGVFRRLLPPERQEVQRLGAAAHDELTRLAERLREEEADAGPGDSASHP
jgi:ParB-like chromosome segregation protein Spo0J